MKRSNVYLAFLASAVVLFGLMLVHAAVIRERSAPRLERTAGMVRSLDATDLCLFTEARYTRHPVMADVNSLFQDSPLSLEHYPTGSLMAPPVHLERRR
ncbi:MAG TPA: hypothetical protein VLT32_05390 [Candidatus Sulfomarinibacteraceae bacterium]|nr:hypothetical protein [Candidatus Sulfomarinibacteraceae bacterium]